MVRILGVAVVVMILPLFAWLILPAVVVVAAVAAVPATSIALAMAVTTSQADDHSDSDEDGAARRTGWLRRIDRRARRRKCRSVVTAGRPAPLGSAGPGRTARRRSPWSFPTRP
jgi:hypothetical protein